MTVRNNEQIWRVVRYLVVEIIGAKWEAATPPYRKHLYDRTAELLKKIANNEFTGDDNHGD